MVCCCCFFLKGIIHSSVLLLNEPLCHKSPCGRIRQENAASDQQCRRAFLGWLYMKFRKEHQRSYGRQNELGISAAPRLAYVDYRKEKLDFGKAQVLLKAKLLLDLCFSESHSCNERPLFQRIELSCPFYCC